MRILGWLAKKKEQIVATGWRLVLYESFNQVYDKLLYAWAIHSLGLVWGWSLMTFGSLVTCAFLFSRYDTQKVDWLFAKAVRTWEDQEGKTWFQNLLARISKSRNGRYGFITFALANTQIDPLIVAVHYRESHFNGISRRDWGVLLTSVGVANLYWGARIGVIVKILEWLYKHFF